MFWNKHFCFPTQGKKLHIRYPVLQSAVMCSASVAKTYNTKNSLVSFKIIYFSSIYKTIVT
jgi:hypothetical protein